MCKVLLYTDTEKVTHIYDYSMEKIDNRANVFNELASLHMIETL